MRMGDQTKQEYLRDVIQAYNEHIISPNSLIPTLTL